MTSYLAVGGVARNTVHLAWSTPMDMNPAVHHRSACGQCFTGPVIASDNLGAVTCARCQSTDAYYYANQSAPSPTVGAHTTGEMHGQESLIPTTGSH